MTVWPFIQANKKADIPSFVTEEKKVKSMDKKNVKGGCLLANGVTKWVSCHFIHGFDVGPVLQEHQRNGGAAMLASMKQSCGSILHHKKGICGDNERYFYKKEID